MLKVNLSRIHSMMKQLAADIRAKRNQAMNALAGGGEFAFKILEGTTDADLAAFMARIEARKQRIADIFLATRQITAYEAYLRKALDTANSRHGVSDKLLELGCIQKEIANLASIRDIILMSCSEDFDPVKGADYYKTSFTDTQKTYEFSVRIFSEKDLAAVEHEIGIKEQEVNALKDQIAVINQTTMVEILSFEDFVRQKKTSS